MINLLLMKMFRVLLPLALLFLWFCNGVSAANLTQVEDINDDEKTKRAAVLLGSAINKLKKFENDHIQLSANSIFFEILSNELLELYKEEHYSEFYELFMALRNSSKNLHTNDEHHDLLMNILLNAIKKDRGCLGKINALIFLGTQDLKNDKTKFDFLISAKVFLEHDSKGDWQGKLCKYDFFDKYIDQKIKNIINGPVTIDVFEVMKISENVIKINDYGSEINDNIFSAQLKLLSLMSEMIKEKLHPKYINQLVKFFGANGSKIYLENFIALHENYFLDFNVKDEIELLDKITIIGEFLSGDRWIFSENHQKVFKKISAIRLKINSENMFYRCIVSHSIILNLKYSDPSKAKKLYKLHLNDCRSLFSYSKIQKRWSSGKIPYLDNSMALMFGAMAINLATEFDDLSTANKIYIEQLPHLLQDEFLEKLKTVKLADRVPFLKIHSYFINFAQIKGDKKNGEKIVRSASKILGIEFDKLFDEEYVNSLRLNLYGKVDDYLDLIKVYRELNGLSQAPEGFYEHLESVLRSRRLGLSAEETIKFIMDSVLRDDFEGIRLGLNQLKRYYSYAKHESDLVGYLMFSETVKKYLETSGSDEQDSGKIPGNINHDRKMLFFQDVADQLAIIHFLHSSSSSDLSQASTLYNLFSLNFHLGRKDHSYFYAMRYVHKVKEILQKIQAASLREEISQNQFSSLGDVIEYFFENELYDEAAFALEVYKVQDFFQSVRGVPSKTKLNAVSDLDSENLVGGPRERVRNLMSPQDSLSKEKFSEIKSVVDGQINAYAARRNSLKKQVAGNSYLIKNLNKFPDSAHLRLFFKSGSLHMIYESTKTENVYVKQSVNPSEFSKNIGNFFSSYLRLQSKNYDIDYFYNIFEKVIKNIEKDSVSTLFISGNSFVNAIPFRLLLISKNPENWKVRLVYSGIAGDDLGDPFRIEGSSLFAVTKGVGGRSKLMFAREEIELIETVLKKDGGKQRRADTFFDEKFSKFNLFTAFNKNHNLIHIATHYDPDPLRGGLLFGDGSVLSSQKLWRELGANSNSPLVTLASCESGLTIGDGKSLDNLPNVFLSKGAKNVLASTWRISDEATKDFMTIFYSFLLVTEDPADSLALTQKSFKEKMFSGEHISRLTKYLNIKQAQESLVKYSHPYFWSGFQLISSN